MRLRVHNRTWLVLIVFGWMALIGWACLTDGFVHQPQWGLWERDR